MATYYRWNKNSIGTVEESSSVPYAESERLTGNRQAICYSAIKPNLNGNTYTLSAKHSLELGTGWTDEKISNYYFGFSATTEKIYTGVETASYVNYTLRLTGSNIISFYAGNGAGSFQEYVYSVNSSDYPTDGESGEYWYNNRTTVTSPTNPSSISYPSTINSLSITVSWQASRSNTNFPISRYELSYSTNGGSSWRVAGTTTSTRYQFGISSPEVTQIQFRVRAMDTNSQYSGYVTGSNSTVQYVPANPPVITLPDNTKLGDTITISWNSVTDATNYILQRKVDGGGWTQIYSGANLSTTNLVDNLGISYRIAFNVGSNFTSEWSQEYRLSTYEKLIEMTYLGDDGNYMPLYPRTVASAVVNASDLISTVSLSGTYQGNGIESNTILLNTKEGIEPKIAFVSNTEGNVEIVNNFDVEGNLVVDNNSNVAGEEYSYIVIGKKED